MEDLLVNYLIVGSIIVTLSIYIICASSTKKRRFENYVFTSFARYNSHVVVGKLPTCPKLLTTKSDEKISTKDLIKKDLFITVSKKEWILVDRSLHSSNLRTGDEVLLIDEITKLYYLASFDGKDKTGILDFSFPGKHESHSHVFSYYGKVICKNKLKDEGCSYYY